MTGSPTPQTRASMGFTIDNARLAGGSVARVVVDAQGRIGSRVDCHAPLIDARSQLVVPAFAEPHAHLDRAFSMAITGSNSTGSLDEAIVRFRAAAGRMTAEGLRPGATRALRLLRDSGVGHVRTHTAVGGGLGFRAWEAVEEASREVPEVRVDQVAMPAGLRRHGSERDAVIREAAARGAVAVGGAPHLCEDPVAVTRASVELGAELGIGVDLHVDETDRPEVDTLPALAAAVEATGLGGRAVAAHCCSLAVRAPDRARLEAQLLARAGITVVVCPVSNLALQGRVSGTRGLAPLRLLRDAGVTVALGMDNIRDVVVGLGTADPLRTAWLAALAGHLWDEEGLDWLGRVVISGNRAACRLPTGLDIGDDADLLLVHATSLAEAVALVPGRERLRPVAAAARELTV